jgi:hypothetical protein
MAMGSTQPLTKMSTRNFPGGIFCDITPCNPFKVNGSLGGTNKARNQHEEDRKIEPEKAAGSQRIACCCISEDINLRNYCCENLKRLQ